MACHFLGRLKSTYPFNIKKGKTMPIRKLTDTLYIAPQLTEADVQEAVRLGIQTVICNRPDGEEGSRCCSLPKSVATISSSYPCLLPYRYSLLPALGLSSSATRRIRSRSSCRSRTGRRQSQQL